MRARSHPRLVLFAIVLLGLAASCARAEIVQRDGIRLTFLGKLSPTRLPRRGTSPVRVAVAARIDALTSAAPSLSRIRIEINGHGHFDSRGLPRCTYSQIQPATTADALAACRGSLVGRGSFSSEVIAPEFAPFPGRGELYAFNGTYRGKPAILAHVYGTTPVPASYTIPFVFAPAHGPYGTALEAAMPLAGSEWGYVTGLSLNLGRSFRFGGRPHSFLSAGCPAPSGFSQAVFPFTRATFEFAGGKALTKTLVRSCSVRA